MTVHLELTYSCNWRCKFCYNPRRHDLEPLSLDEWIGVLDELRALGTLTVILTGGEPLAHTAFFEIAAAARERAFALRLLTNGALVCDVSAQRLAELRPLSVELSLHGANAATHDLSTGRTGAFDAMWRGIKRLRRHGVPLTLKTTLTSLNERELDQIIALASERGLPIRLDSNVTPRDDTDRAPLRYTASLEAVQALMLRLAQKGESPRSARASGGFNCGLGRLTMAVDPEGFIYPCIQWRRPPLGNVREQALRELWSTSSVRLEAAEVARQANDVILGLGGAAAGFPYCPALAQMHTGDPLQPHDAFFDAAEAARAARLLAGG